MTELWRQIETGLRDPDVHLDEAHRGLEELTGQTLPRLHEQWRDAQHLIDANVDLVRRLRAWRFRTAVLSNASNTLVHRLTVELGIADLFDVIVSSADVGVAKPDAKIYAIAAARLGLPPSACVFIDDGEANVEAARHVGMEAVLYRVDRGDVLEDQLHALGVGAPSGA